MWTCSYVDRYSIMTSMLAASMLGDEFNCYLLNFMSYFLE
jgi:hypothetical protein